MPPPAQLPISAPSRDVLLDAMRAISVLRVLVVHTLNRYDTDALLVLSFVHPGMPILFAVSGALSFAALTRDGAAVESFLRGRLRRILLPFWLYGGLVVAFLLGLEFLRDHPWRDVSWMHVWRWAIPLAGPMASEGSRILALHLWFVPPFLWLVAAAPVLVALHRRAPGLGAAAALIASAALEIHRKNIPGAFADTLAFSVAFQAGFFWADGTMRTARGVALAAAAAMLWGLGFLLHQHLTPGLQLYSIPVAHVLVGLASLPIWALARAPMERLFSQANLSAISSLLNRRSYTLFLWGPGAGAVAWRLSGHAPEAAKFLVHAGGSLSILAMCVWIFGRVEDAAKRRSQSAQLVPSGVRQARRSPNEI